MFAARRALYTVSARPVLHVAPRIAVATRSYADKQGAPTKSHPDATMPHITEETKAYERIYEKGKPTTDQSPVEDEGVTAQELIEGDAEAEKNAPEVVKENLNKFAVPEPLEKGKYDDIVQLFVGVIMKDGKKARAQNVLQKAFDVLKLKTGGNPLQAFAEAMERAAPLMSIRTSVKGTKKVQVPVPLNERQRHRHGIRWIIKHSESRKHKELHLRIADELLAVLDGTSNVFNDKFEVHRQCLLNRASASKLVDVDAQDESGTTPLIMAACFGRTDVVKALLEAHADVNKQDKYGWTATMWASNNNHPDLIKELVAHGASTTTKTTSGRTALDFAAPETSTEVAGFLTRGNDDSPEIGTLGMMAGSDDWYDRGGFSEDRFEEQMAEDEFQKRLMMESAANLEVDLSSLGLDDTTDSPFLEEIDEGPSFDYSRCLPSQMFVFSEEDLPHIFDVVITRMQPVRSPAQKPVPANVLFLCARFAHYFSTPELMMKLLDGAVLRIQDVTKKRAEDMANLAFWISNCTLLLYHMKKDQGLVGVTIPHQQEISELINDIWMLLIQDAERRLDKVLDAGMLDNETIPGLQNVQFENEWRLFRSRKKEAPVEGVRPPSPRRRAGPSPRNITSLLSSTLFVMEAYDVHPVIIAQTFSQLFFWVGGELFNRIITKKKYLARSRAMQIRMNVSALEDWATRTNILRKEEQSEMSSQPSIHEAARHHLIPVNQLLQWLQVLSSIGDDVDALETTRESLHRLTLPQLARAVRDYRYEVGEGKLSSAVKKIIFDVPTQKADEKQKIDSLADHLYEEEDAITLDTTYMLPFKLATTTEMILAYGAGIGGTNRERERRYTPFLPAEFLDKLDAEKKKAQGEIESGSNGKTWEEEAAGIEDLRRADLSTVEARW
ncbi:hypothetical protein SAICODRAFT_17788 [Saitoella complicata NRRL Y-17804]|uniref:uncharacterized protein n=1 Tax=Saitoella complicata (strain BCRC 22490 / CBS 7301 / JCM 7358 / NBRC 10748 / NRRL Y-17804) TaxID=698492 RepID=UPI00086695AD|nr:uncharacterized protein SAICODRAFT_17788 [Saitoella complicata NRRL Y-17804]ODQ54799.1 hypothetical protein SAICODRAFT_17788 [Saitoella complicata NRRL Y-17804]